MEVPQSASSAPLSAIQKQKKHFGDHCHSKCDCLPAAQKAAGTDVSTISNPDLTEQVGKWTKITKPKNHQYASAFGANPQFYEALTAAFAGNAGIVLQ
jgi:hypothetical protein